MKYTKKTAFEAADVFGIGAPNDTYAQYFIGQSFLKPLTEPEKAPVFLANVTFEPRCRNNWHIHHATKGGGQILICTCRRGLVSGGGQACRQPESRHSNHHSGRGQTLARCQKGQLVQPHCSGMPRRKLQQRMVRAGKRCRIRKIGKR